jgi:hypothetical protein
VDADHVMLAKRFDEKLNSPLKQLAKIRPNVFNFKIYQSFLVQKILSRRMFCNKSNFCKMLPF